MSKPAPLTIEHVQDGAGQQRLRRLLPVIAPVARAFPVDQHVGDILHVAHFLLAGAHFEQRFEPGRVGIGRIEQQAIREAGAPAGRELPVLALDVVDDGGAGSGQQRRQDQADALARACRCHGDNALRPMDSVQNCSYGRNWPIEERGGFRGI